MEKVLTAAQVAALIGKTKSSLHADMVRKPESLPPWFKLPKSRRPLWLESTVQQFLLSQAGQAGALPRNVRDKK